MFERFTNTVAFVDFSNKSGDSALFDKFTDRSRKVIQLARNEAERTGSEFADSLHLLAGLIREGSGVAWYVLTELGASLPTVREMMENDDYQAGKRAQLHPEVIDIIKAAKNQAYELGHQSVGTEHLLLGLLTLPCEASIALRNMDIRSDYVREMVIDTVNPQPNYQQKDHLVEKIRRILSATNAKNWRESFVKLKELVEPN